MNNQQVIPKRNDFYDTLDAIDRGSVTKELRAAVRECTQASINTMRKSVITVEITIDPDTKTEPLAMRVSANIKMKKPASPRKAGIFYPTATGDLSREHPHQRDIEEATDALPRIEAKPAHDPDTGEILQSGGGDVRE